ncbi:MAG: D-tyrosyl-tRNA(Tyr) deacylase [Chloroflexi bacterium]|nr:MAG: D-tyrosyl-tRNA(Tyr) deacylase [Chloroflexota bacterium]
MRAIIQRVSRGRVSVEGRTLGEIGAGLVILRGVGHGDGQADADRMADKITNLRIFSDAEGKTNLSLLDVGGEALVISQFTLYADCRKGRRPSFVYAAPPELAEPLVEYLAGRLRQNGVSRVERGEFGAVMLVEIHNDGPFTIYLDSTDLTR